MIVIQKTEANCAPSPLPQPVPRGEEGQLEEEYNSDSKTETHGVFSLYLSLSISRIEGEAHPVLYRIFAKN